MPSLHQIRALCLSFSVLAASSALGACSTGAPAGAPVAVGKTSQALWTNGDFEGDNIGVTPPMGWTVTTYSNSSGVTGSSTSAPSSFTALNLTANAGKLETFVVGGAPETQVDPDLGAGQAFRFPKYGSRGTRVNYKDATDSGKNKNANGLRQSMTIALGDVDPTDGLVHVRFAVAPVLENPSHGYTQQPYYFVELLDITRGTTLYHDFNTAGQSGVPWNTTTSLVTGNTTQWTNWQLVDLAPGPSAIAVGDQVQLTVIGSGCSLGGHFGRVYVDGTGASVPGIYAWASGPASAAAGASITYTINYSNGGATTATGAHLDMVIPPQTTFQSVSAANCTTPIFGGTGTISCPLGSLASGTRGSFTVTVNINIAATGNVVNGNYSIAAVNSSALIGAKVTTSVLTSGTRTSDLRVTKTANVTSTDWGSAVKYTITVHNSGPNSVSATQLGFQDIMPAQLTGATWTCAKTIGGTSTNCNTASGTGNISTRPKIGNGGEIVYTVNATVVAGSGFGTVTNSATASLTGRTDPNLNNNTSVLALSIGTPRTLTLTKAGSTVSGSISSQPVGLSCGTGCSSTSATYADGSQVLLSATPIPGATFTGWSGACSGSASTCTVTMSGNQSVTATFAAAPAVGAAAFVYVYTGDKQAARTSTPFGSNIAALVTDANGTPLNNVTVTFTAPASGASATLPFFATTTANTNASGIASLAAFANATAGTYGVTAKVTGVATPATFTLTNVGAPALITYVSGGNATDPNQAPTNGKFPSPLTGLVKDAAGNPVPGATVTFAVPGSGASATLSSTTATTDSNGFATVSATANNTLGSYDVTASVAGVATPVTFKLQNISAAAASVFVISGSPQHTPTSTAFDDALVVGVADAVGNALANVMVTFTVPSSGASATLSSLTATTNSLGVATITATSNATVGSYVVNASVSGVVNPAVFALTNDGAQLVDVQSGSPQTATVGTAFAPLVAIVSDSTTGLPISGVTVTFTVPGSGATAVLGAASAVTDSSGLATVTATAGNVAGTYSVSATTALAGAATSFALSNAPGAPASIVITSGDNQHAVISTGFTNPLVVTVQDAKGNPVPSASVTFTPPGSGASAVITGSPALTSSSGQASVTAAANATSGGAYTIAASVSGVGSPASFSFTNDPPAGCTLDSQCLSTQFCDTVAHACVNKLANGVSIPTLAGHAPALTGACSGPVGMAVCVSSVCDSDGKCGYKDGTGTCDGSTAPVVCRNGACSTASVCMPSGGCAVPADCNFANATAGCTAFACVIASCNAGYSNCDSNASNGCELQTGGSDVNNCGGCGTVCNLTHATAACTLGTCTVGTCNAGFGDCNAAAADGCELNTAGSDVNNCGGCGTVCSAPHATAACAVGACVVGTCNAGFGDCNATASDGCELATDADDHNCGACGNVCGSTTYCTGGSCVAKKANSVACTASSQCSSGSCDTDHLCGVPNGKSCAGVGAAICRGGACSVSNVCMDTGGCLVDGDCTSSQFCDTSANKCTPKLPNDTLVPTISGHAPPLTGACTVGVGSVVCSANVCDTTDDKCGYQNGDGACSTSSAITVCRSSVCGSDDKCGYPDGEGNCSAGNATTVCRSGLCSASTHKCVGAAQCILDSDCTRSEFCDTSLGACTPKLGNGTAVPVIAGHAPALTGACTVPVGNAVCSADVCDTADDKCGYQNGDGSCDGTSAGVVCRSSVCGSDSKCGYPDGEGPCTSVDAGTICRSGLCSATTFLCVAPAACTLDSDCPSTQFCDTATNLCTRKLKNGTEIPTIAGHAPPLTGVCDTSVGTAVCSASACDTKDDKCGYQNGDGSCGAGAGPVCRSSVCGSDDKCGYPDGEGPCTSVNAGTVCRSGMCSKSSHVCIAANGCELDADCSSTHFCNTVTSLCTPKLADGVHVPTIAHHTPALTGACNVSVGAAVCQAAVCDLADDKCAYANGDGACTASTAAELCRSNVCGADKKCGYPDGEGPCTSSNASVTCRSGMCSSASLVCLSVGGCAIDADCSGDQFCDSAERSCKPKLVNGAAVPSIAQHTPALTGVCTADVGTAVCKAGVCDTADNQCGYPDGMGPCTAANATSVCRTGSCSTDGVCGAGTPTMLGCANDASCNATQYCELAAHSCTAKKPDGDGCAANDQCVSASCDTVTHVCNTCFGSTCGRLKLAGGGCSLRNVGDASTRGSLAVFLVLGLALSVRARRRRLG